MISKEYMTPNTSVLHAALGIFYCSLTSFLTFLPAVVGVYLTTFHTRHICKGVKTKRACV